MKKKVLLLSDDLRVPSGIGTMSKEFIKGTLNHFDWVQIGGAIKHPEKGKIFDLSQAMSEESGVKNAYVKVYPVDGYGDPNILREVLRIEKPDAILHFTDPRFWQWLYNMEHEVRQNIPLMYYNIWDDLPYPHWNEPFYESCDLIMNISRQTQNIVKNVLQKFPKPDWAVQWVPHGVNQQQFFPITETHPVYPEFDQFRRSFGNGKQYDFIVFWNNRNIRRKQPGDVILSYKTFCDGLTKEQASRTLLLMHTQPVDNNGTDLTAVRKALCPDYNVRFTDGKLDTKYLNYLYLLYLKLLKLFCLI